MERLPLRSACAIWYSGVSDVIPKSTNPDRISENADIFNFTLSDLDMDLIDSMDEQFRSASIPEDMIGQGVH